MKKIKYPDYANSTVSLANSILKYFGAPVHHETLGLLDRKFAEREYENVVVILLDGMGKCIIDGNLEPDGFFASHLAGTYSAVFPPTTVAATTSICSGLYPVEHCWLGWDCYYPKIDKTVTVFLNREAGTTKPAADYPVAKTLCPYQSLVEQIRENSGQAYSLIPFEEPYPGTFEEISDGIERLTKRPGKKYIYAYWPEPDGCMHEKGCYSPEAKENLRQLEKQVQQLTEKLSRDGTPVYFTIDLDCLDPSCFPGTGTPEAGGVTFIQLLDAIRKVAKTKIIGADANELAPMLDASGVSTAMACKVLRELLLALNENLSAEKQTDKIQEK